MARGDPGEYDNDLAKASAAISDTLDGRDSEFQGLVTQLFHPLQKMLLSDEMSKAMSQTQQPPPQSQSAGSAAESATSALSESLSAMPDGDVTDRVARGCDEFHKKKLANDLTINAKKERRDTAPPEMIVSSKSDSRTLHCPGFAGQIFSPGGGEGGADRERAGGLLRQRGT